MPFDVHTVEVVDAASGTTGNALLNQDKVVIAKLDSVVNAAGAIGATVATAITFAAELPANYAVLVNPNQNCADWITSKTSSGFTVNLAPAGVNGTLTAAGSVSTGAATIVMAATVPQWVIKGMNVWDVTGGTQVGTVSSISNTTLTLAANAVTQGVGTADVLQFGFFSMAAGTFDVLVVA